MFGLDFSDLYDKLPTPLQVAVIIGVAAAAFFAAYKGFVKGLSRTVVTADGEHPNGDDDRFTHAVDSAKLAAALANEQLRGQLIDVVRIAREALQQRIDQQVAAMQTDIKAVEERDRSGRAAIFQRIERAEDRIQQVELNIERIRPRTR